MGVILPRKRRARTYLGCGGASCLGLIFWAMIACCLVFTVAGLSTEIKTVKTEKPEAINFILGQSHFIRTVEDIHKTIKIIPEVARVFCATANPTEVLVAETGQGRGILGVVDDFPPKGVERVTRRVNDVVEYQSPIWRMDVPATVAGQRVAVVDEIADTGETLAIVGARAHERGARQVWTLSLVAHSWANPQPDFTALTTDALLIFPWDKQVLTSEGWQLHPEIESAIRAQDKSSLNG